VTSVIVSSPDSTHEPSAGRSPVLVKDISGYRSASKKSADRRWLSRIWLPVLTDGTAITAAAVDPGRSALATTCPLTSLNVPRTRLIKCRTLKLTTVWAESIVHVPATRHPPGQARRGRC